VATRDTSPHQPARQPVPLGGARGPEDGCRRYRPLKVDFDTRNVVLDLVIQDDWEPDNKALWEENQRQVQAGLVAELGPVNAEQKLDNYRAMGPAPWSVVFSHTVLQLPRNPTRTAIPGNAAISVRCLT
jgi:hypothetical protein